VHSRRPDQGLHFSFQPFTFFDANRHDAISSVEAPPPAASRPDSSFLAACGQCSTSAGRQACAQSDSRR
jgi:hypothetical protein